MATVQSPPEVIIKRARRGALEIGEERLAWTMLTPVLLALLALGVYPALSTLWFSFQTGGTFGQGTSLAGLANYTRLLRDIQFWNAFKFSILYSIITVIGQMILGTALALFANRKFPGRWVARAAILFPWAIPTATNSVIWAYIFNGQYGLINSLLEHVGLISSTHPINWLGSPQLATLLIYVLAIWKANSLWRVTLPLLRPTLAVTLILRTIESLQAFDLISAFTNGAPGNATQNIGLYIYVQIQQYGDFGYGSTIAMVLMIVTLAFIVVYMRAFQRPGLR